MSQEWEQKARTEYMYQLDWIARDIIILPYVYITYHLFSARYERCGKLQKKVPVGAVAMI